MLPPTRQRLLRGAGLLAMLVWACAVGAGLERIWEYKSTPGSAVPSPAHWPGSNLIKPLPGRNALVMFVHPHCPCSRASLTEFSRIVEREQGRASAWILFLRPQGTAENWEHTDAWEKARHIPGVTVLTDAAGDEAARFGVATSGHVVLYDAQGRLLFSGGITGSRGHEGDNAGQQRLLNLLAGRTADAADHPVYGCGLRDLDTPQT